MQQFCPYGSVRGAPGQPASLPRQRTARLPNVNAECRMPNFIHRDVWHLALAIDFGFQTTC